MVSQALAIGMKDLKVRFRDKKTLIMTFLLPIVLIVITGSAFKGMEAGNMAAAVTVTNLDEGGDLSAEFVKAMQQTASLKVETAPDFEAAQKRVAQGETDAAVKISKDFSKKIRAGDISVVEVALNAEQVVKSELVKGVVGGIVENFAGRALVPLMVYQSATSLKVADAERDKLVADTSDRVGKLALNEMPVQLKTKQVSGNEGMVGYSAFSHAVSGNGIMFILMCCTIAGGMTVIRERQTGTLSRLLIAPVSRLTIFSGKVFAIFVSGIVQALVVFGFGVLVCQVTLGSPVGVAILTLAFVLSATALGVTMSALVRKEQQVEAIAIPLTLVLSALGGGWFPMEITPKWMQMASLTLPTGWAMKGYHDLMWHGRGIVEVLPAICVIMIFAAAFAAIGVSKLKLE